MKTFKEFITEEPKKEKPVEFFAHFKQNDPNHNIELENDSGEAPIEFFAHFKQNDPKHNIDLEKGKSIEEQYDQFLKNTYKRIKPIKVTTINKGVAEKSSRAAIKHHKSIPTLSDHQTAVFSYTQSSREVNKNLIKGEKSNIGRGREIAMIKRLDAVTKHKDNSTKSRMSVYSGVGLEFGNKLSKVKVGGKLHSPAYISATLRPRIAHNFTKEGGTFANPELHTIQFHLPKGYSKGRHIDHLSAHTHEDEYLMARGQHFKKVGEQRFANKVDDYAEPRIVTHVIHHLEPIDSPKKSTNKPSSLKKATKKIK